MRLDVAKVTSLLREKIGTMVSGDALPGIRVLMKEYGVSQSLVQQAYMTFKQEGLIENGIVKFSCFDQNGVSLEYKEL